MSNVRSVLLALLLLAPVLPGCSYDEADDDGNVDLLELGGFDIRLSIGSNDDDPHQPIYNWDPEQPAFTLRVTRGDAEDAAVWGLQTNTGAADMDPPVVHGHTNPGTHEIPVTDPEPELEPGVTYTVVVQTQVAGGVPQSSWAQFRLKE